MQENEPMRYHIEDPSNEKRINIVLLIDGRWALVYKGDSSRMTFKGDPDTGPGGSY